MLSKDSIAVCMRGPVKPVDVPEWAGQVGVRKLSAADLMYLREMTEREPKPDDLTMTCELLALALCDEIGQTMFTPAELRQWDGQQTAIMQRLIAETQAHNGIGETATEELRKNSESGPTSVST